jgi:hypothetical protein
MPDFTVTPGETITINVTGAAAPNAGGNNDNYPNVASNGASVASNNSAFGGGYRRNRNRKNKTNRRNRKNKTNRRNRMY